NRSRRARADARRDPDTERSDSRKEDKESSGAERQLMCISEPEHQRGDRLAGTRTPTLHFKLNLALTILIANRVEDIENTRRAVEGGHSVAHATGDVVHIACLQDFLFVANLKQRRP